MNMNVHGFVDPESVETLSRSWTPNLKQDIRLLSLYVHWHLMLTRAEVSIKRLNRQKDLILDLDAHKFWGTKSLPDSALVHMHAGDELVLDCVFDNRVNETREIGYACPFPFLHLVLD